MQVSAEIRWFWNSKPSIVQNWFCGGNFAPGGGETRDDVYLLDASQSELGVKKRGKKSGVEIKGLVGHAQVGDPGPWPAASQPEIWCKWSSSAIDISTFATITTVKVRWLRKFDTSSGAANEVKLGPDEMPTSGGLPEQGCNVEFTQIAIAGRPENWWTLGFEAFGEIETVAYNLRTTLKGMKPPGQASFDSSELLSYPAWLSKINRATI